MKNLNFSSLCIENVPTSADPNIAPFALSLFETQYLKLFSHPHKKKKEKKPEKLVRKKCYLMMEFNTLHVKGQMSKSVCVHVHCAFFSISN